MSEDFVNWTDSVSLKYPGVPADQFYTNQINPYCRASHVLVGFPLRYAQFRWLPIVEVLPGPEHRRLRS